MIDKEDLVRTLKEPQEPKTIQQNLKEVNFKERPHSLQHLHLLQKDEQGGKRLQESPEDCITSSWEWWVRVTPAHELCLH